MYNNIKVYIHLLDELGASLSTKCTLINNYLSCFLYFIS